MAGISSNLLKNKKEKVLSIWEERCLKEVASAGTVTALSLRNSLPIYLDHLSDALASNRKLDFKSILAHEDKSTRIGKMHGADRAGSQSYSLKEVMFEYHILREVIFQVLEAEGPLGPVQRDIIYDSIEQAVNDAAVEFSELHSDIQQVFINTLSHDLKTPITAAKMSADLILKRSDLPEEEIRLVRRIMTNMNRLTSMIHDLLDTSRLRAGESLALQFEKCDLDSMVRQVIDEMLLVHGDRFLYSSPGAVEGNWSCDGLRRAIENLIGNAVKYSTPKTPITVLLKRRKNDVEVTVHNQGTAISKNEIPLLFQPYRRSKSAQEGGKTGWGLGLTLVKGVVDAHKGKVSVKSEEGKGTTFILEIPSATPSNPQASS